MGQYWCEYTLDGNIKAELSMEHKVRIVSPKAIMEPLLALLDEVEAVPLVISGGSMTPFLVHGRDTVYLSKVKKPLKKGDMVLYQRLGGSYVLHRILKVEGSLYTMVGDAQTHLELGIHESQIRAIVTAVRRKDKLLQKGSFWWIFFEKIWVRMVPLRPAVRKAYSFIKRLLGNKGAI